MRTQPRDSICATKLGLGGWQAGKRIDPPARHGYKGRVKKQVEATPATGPAPGLRRYLYLTAAVSGAAVMIVEILGAKLLAPYLGTSHFVWTAQIAVTLLALATGYALGGWLVDRSPRLTWVYAGLVLAAAYLGLSVLGVETIAFACLRWKLATGSLLAALALFFAPLALLAMVGPFLVRVLTVSVANVGANVGRLTAISTLGSVAGTVLIGYVLIPFLPNSLTMYLTAAALMAVAAAYFLVWERRHAAPAALGIAFGALVGGGGVLQPTLADPDRFTELYRGNSNFGLLQVVDEKAGHRRYYLNDLLIQNTYDLAGKRSDSLFTGMLHDLARAYTTNLNDALCIGVGMGLAPMALAREGVKVDAVEINPAVVPLAARFFGFQPTQVNLTFGDGRYYVTQCARQYDAILLDAFLGESPPSHLMSREAFAAMRRCLRPGGALVMNTFGEFAAGRDFLPASLEKTLRAVFKSVRVHASGGGNVFFVASDRPELQPVGGPDYESMPAWLRGQARDAFEGVMQTDPNHGLVLTDDYNPVDVRDALNREELRRRLVLAYRRF
jgi:spermidine synthase